MIEYLKWQGVELANNARTTVYAANGVRPARLSVKDVCTCDPTEFATVVDGAPYVLPSTDPAPWFSTAEPLSGDVAGLLVQDITGLDTTPVVRQVSERVTHGSTIGRSRYTTRTIVISGVIIARTVEAAEWYVRYLSEQLADSPCPSPSRSCAGHDACFYVSCPKPEVDCNPNDVLPDSFADRLNSYARTLHRVALFSGPDIVERKSSGCEGCQSHYELLTVQFTMVAGDPFAYTTPVTVLTGEPLEECYGPMECVEWVVVGPEEECPDPCGTVDPCGVDELCDPRITPPELPMISDPCVCDPLTASMTCFDIPKEVFDPQGVNVPVIQVTAGDTDVRNLKISFIPNPLELPAEELSICSTCSEINLSFLPALGTWTFDASRRETTVFCPPLQTSQALVSGANGGPLVWPEFVCPTVDHVMCVELSCDSWSEDLTLSMDMVARQT